MNSKSQTKKKTITAETDTINLEWDQRPKLHLEIADLNGNKKKIYKGDTLLVTVSMTDVLKQLKGKSKVVLNPKIFNNCSLKQLNDSVFKLFVFENPKGNLLTFELMLYKPNTVFSLPIKFNGTEEVVSREYYRDTLGMSAFAYEIN